MGGGRVWGRDMGMEVKEGGRAAGKIFEMSIGDGVGHAGVYG